MYENKLTLVEHLEELRSRIIKSAIVIFIASCIIYNCIDKIIVFFIMPVGRLVFIAPQEAFIVNIKIAFFLGLFVSSPYVLFQVWRFISTGLKANEKKYTLLFGIFSFILFISGCLFGYFIIVPIGLRFLLGFASDYLQPMISANTYVSFVCTLSFAFSLVFQLPLVILFLTKIGIVTPQILSKRRREMIVAIFIVAAIFTPPDVVTQVLMAMPLLILYEIGIIFSKIAYRKYKIT